MHNGVMTGAGVRNYEFRNPAPEEGFCGIQRTEFRVVRNPTGTFRFSRTLYWGWGVAVHNVSHLGLCSR
jgi:hypothetical protein